MMEEMSTEEEFLLKWNNHQSNLIGVFKEWLKDESFVDVTLVCGGEAVSGHKVVLAACSPLLNRILHDNPCRHPVVILNDVCSADMKALLKFIYQGEVSVSQSELASFLRTADNLQIKGLAEDREKEEKKRKEKDDTMGGTRKKRKTEFRNSSTPQSHIYNKNNEDTVASSPKSQIQYITNKDKFSSLNSQNQISSGIVFTNSMNHRLLTNTNSNITHTLEIEYDISKPLSVKEGELVVKTEPLDYAGEMVWQEGNSLIKKENSDHEENVNTISNASSSSNNSIHNPHSTTLPFSVLQSSLENLGSSSAADFQKNFDSIHTEEKRLEEDGQNLPLGSEDLNQSNILAGRGVGCAKELVGEASDDVEVQLPIHSESLLSSTPSGTEPALMSSDDAAFIQDTNMPPTSAAFSVIAPFSSSSSNAYYSMNGSLFSCRNCSFQSRNPYTFNRHLRIHYGTKEFQCSSCDYASTRKDSLIRHVRVKHFASDLVSLSSMKGAQVSFQQS